MKNSLKVFLLSAALLFAGCAGGNSGSESTGKPSDPTPSLPEKPNSETPKPSTPKPVETTFSATALDIITEKEKSFVKVTGAYTGYTSADEMKMAFALISREASGSDSVAGVVIMGSEVPGASDYKYVPTIDATAGTYELKVDVSEVKFESGIYDVYVGPRGHFEKVSLEQASGGIGKGSAKVNGYRIYLRVDLGAIAADKLPPIALTDSFIRVEENKAYHYIGGELSMTEAEFKALTPYVLYETTVGTWKQNVIDDALISTVMEGGKGFVKVDVTDLPEERYNVKLNLTEKVQVDTKMETVIDTTATPTVLGTKGYAIYADSSKNAKEDIYGNLGLVITHIHTYEAKGDKVGDLQPLSCTCNPTAYELDHVGGKIKANKTWNITGITSGEYEIYLDGHASTGNGGAGFTGQQVLTGYYSRYAFQVGTNTEEEIYDSSSYNDFGWEAGDTATSKYTVKPVAKISIQDTDTEFKMNWHGEGYSAFVDHIRLVKSGNYVAPATKLAADTVKMEAENSTLVSGSNGGTVTADEATSGGNYVAGLTAASSGWWGVNYGERTFKVVAPADMKVQVKVNYKSASAEKGAFELWVDGAKVETMGTTQAAWTVATSEAKIDLTAGHHSIVIRGIQDVTVDIDYVEIVKAAA